MHRTRITIADGTVLDVGSELPLSEPAIQYLRTQTRGDIEDACRMGEAMNAAVAIYAQRIDELVLENL